MKNTTGTRLPTIPQLACAGALGVAVATSGWVLADSTLRDSALAVREARAQAEALGQSLVDTQLAAITRRLDEIAALPLLAEFVELTRTAPEGPDAAELKAYLSDVLDSTRGELDTREVRIVDDTGKLLLASGTMPEEAQEPLHWSAPIPSSSGADASAGRIIVSISSDRFAVLDAAGLAARPGPTRDRSLKVSSVSTEDGGRSALLLRLYALAAGLIVFVTSGFSFAGIARHRLARAAAPAPGVTPRR